MYQLIIHYTLKTEHGIRVTTHKPTFETKKAAKAYWKPYFEANIKGREPVWWTKILVKGEVLEDHARGI